MNSIDGSLQPSSPSHIPGGSERGRGNLPPLIALSIRATTHNCSISNLRSSEGKSRALYRSFAEEGLAPNLGFDDVRVAAKAASTTNRLSSR